MSDFSTDFTTCHVDAWKKWLKPFTGEKNINGIEVGCFEGQSSKWFLDNVLTDPTSSLTCVDFRLNLTFAKTVRPYGSKVQFYNVASNVGLHSLPMNHFDFAYVDGGHGAPNALEDAVLTWLALKKGGILIFDDYLKDYDSPKVQIDAFLSIYSEKLSIIAKCFQVCVVKK